MPEFKIRVEFDVEVDDDSYIGAAFAAADWLQERAAAGRFSYLVYEVAKHPDGEYKSVDLEEIGYPEGDLSDTEPCILAGNHLPSQLHHWQACPVDTNPCSLAGEHLKGQRHRWQECPTYHEGEAR